MWPPVPPARRRDSVLYSSSRYKLRLQILKQDSFSILPRRSGCFPSHQKPARRPLVLRTAREAFEAGLFESQLFNNALSYQAVLAHTRLCT